MDRDTAPAGFGLWAVPLLFEQLKSPGSEARLRALNSLCDLLHEPERLYQTVTGGFVSELGPLIQDPDPAVRIRTCDLLHQLTAHAIGRRSFLSSSLLAPLCLLIDDGDRRCRVAMHRVLNHLVLLPQGAEVLLSFVPELMLKLKKEIGGLEKQLGGQEEELGGQEEEQIGHREEELGGWEEGQIGHQEEELGGREEEQIGHQEEKLGGQEEEQIGHQEEELGGQGEEVEGQEEEIGGQGAEEEVQEEEIGGQGEEVEGQEEEMGRQEEEQIEHQEEEIGGQGEDEEGLEEELKDLNEEVENQEGGNKERENKGEEERGEEERREEERQEEDPEKGKQKSPSDSDEELVLLLSSLALCSHLDALPALTSGGVALFGRALTHPSPLVRSEAADAMMALSVPFEGKQEIVSLGILSVVRTMLEDPDTEVRIRAAGIIMNTAIITEGKVQGLGLGLVQVLLDLIGSEELSPVSLDPKPDLDPEQTQKRKTLVQFCLRSLMVLSEAPDARLQLQEQHDLLERRTYSDPELMSTIHRLLRVISWTP